jgi:hypothetical protein
MKAAGLAMRMVGCHYSGNYVACRCSNKSAKSDAYNIMSLRWRPWALGRKIMLALCHLIRLEN